MLLKQLVLIMDLIDNLNFIHKTKIDINQLWRCANEGREIEWKGKIYQIETIKQDFYPNIPRLTVVLFRECEGARTKWNRRNIERVELTKPEEFSSLRFH